MSKEEKRTRDYIVGCLETIDFCVDFDYHKNDRFINDVISRYEKNLKYIEDGYSETDAKDDAIRDTINAWK